MKNEEKHCGFLLTSSFMREKYLLMRRVSFSMRQNNSAMPPDYVVYAPKSLTYAPAANSHQNKRTSTALFDKNRGVT
ncbi:hypothetical protein [Falsibacillus pallidus]|uniref:hypothetical protein n=1 Tax=Falsibacillus pallidus TaxID=493781 RepID=UPI0011C04D74|nr:hypothetical protein [Falsibacillus pallidus]